MFLHGFGRLQYSKDRAGLRAKTWRLRLYFCERNMRLGPIPPRPELVAANISQSIRLIRYDHEHCFGIRGWSEHAISCSLIFTPYFTRQWTYSKYWSIQKLISFSQTKHCYLNLEDSTHHSNFPVEKKPQCDRLQIFMAANICFRNWSCTHADPWENRLTEKGKKAILHCHQKSAMIH